MERTVKLDGWKTREFGPVSTEIMQALEIPHEWYFNLVENENLTNDDIVPVIVQHCLGDAFSAKWPALSNAAQSWVNMSVSAINNSTDGNVSFPRLDLPQPNFKTIDMALELSREADEIVARLEHKNVSATLRARELCILHPEFSIQQLMHTLGKEGFTLSRSVLTANRSQTKQALMARNRVLMELGEEETERRIARLLNTPLTAPKG